MNKKYLIYSVIISFYVPRAGAITFDVRKFFNPKAALRYVIQAEFPLIDLFFLNPLYEEHNFAANNNLCERFHYLSQHHLLKRTLPQTLQNNKKNIPLISIATDLVTISAASKYPNFFLHRWIESAMHAMQQIPCVGHMATTAYDHDNDQVIKFGKYSIRKKYVSFLSRLLAICYVDTKTANLLDIQIQPTSTVSITSQEKVFGCNTESITDYIVNKLRKLCEIDTVQIAPPNVLSKNSVKGRTLFRFNATDWWATMLVTNLSGPWGKYYQTPAIVGIKLLLDAISTKPTAKTTQKKDTNIPLSKKTQKRLRSLKTTKRNEKSDI